MVDPNKTEALTKLKNDYARDHFGFANFNELRSDQQVQVCNIIIYKYMIVIEGLENKCERIIQRTADNGPRY